MDPWICADRASAVDLLSFLSYRWGGSGLFLRRAARLLRSSTLLVAIVAQGTGTVAVAAPASVGAESIVLITVKPKDPFSSQSRALPVMYIKEALSPQEARGHMRPQWVGPAAQPQSEVGALLAVYGGPVMTRQKFVESTLSAYEKAGGKRSNVRVDVLSAGIAAETQAAQPATRPSPRAENAPTAPAVAGSSKPSSQGECVKFVISSASVDRDFAPNRPLVRNDCGSTVGVALGRRNQPGTECTPSSLAPGQKRDYVMSSVRAICRYATVVTQQEVLNDMLKCRCPAGSTSIEVPK